MMPSVPQLLIILVIVVLIFGAKRLRNLGGDLGSAVKGFKQAVKEENEEKGEPARLENEGEPVAESPPTEPAVARESDEHKRAS